MFKNYSYWIWKNIFNLKEVKNLNKFIMSNYCSVEDKQHHAYHLDGTSKKNVETYVIKYEKIKSYISNALELAYDANKKQFGFDIWPYHNMDSCLYNIYSENKNANYDWHIDQGNSPYADIKFTLIINLSEKEFEGGDLFLQEGNDIEVKELKEIGNMILFKSYTRHMVTPVTKGERRNLVLFLTGPNFK
jgi:predicted 2-oxoglutarate/Fe(II)-dependent dioxygenase YbiX